MNDISTAADADSGMCWVSKVEILNTKNEFGSL